MRRIPFTRTSPILVGLRLPHMLFVGVGDMFSALLVARLTSRFDVPAYMCWGKEVWKGGKIIRDAWSAIQPGAFQDCLLIRAPHEIELLGHGIGVAVLSFGKNSLGKIPLEFRVDSSQSALLTHGRSLPPLYMPEGVSHWGEVRSERTVV